MNTCEAVFDARQTALDAALNAALNAGAATRAVVEERAITARLFLLFEYPVVFALRFLFLFQQSWKSLQLRRGSLGALL
jgi:hypothetical protein